jgi:arylsulfatase A-like enzyme
MEIADEVTPNALKWIDEHAEEDNWFLHVNYWDPHTPYRTPEEFGNPFENDPLDPWYTEELRKRSCEGFGPHSGRELHDYPSEALNERMKDFPRVDMESLDSMAEVKRYIDGYDTGIRYADYHVGLLLEALTEKGILDDIAIIVTSDHGESQGELNQWGDHQSADDIICRVPLIISWPGKGGEGRVDSALHQHFDWAATMLELADAEVPNNWDGLSFADSFIKEESAGREFLVTSQAAWSCQRGVRFDHEGEKYICLRTYHDGHKDFDRIMLYNLSNDPHEENNLANEEPAIVELAMKHLTEWQHDQMLTATSDIDPMVTVLREGGPFHTRGRLAQYCEHLRKTNRAHHAEKLERRHPDELQKEYPY